MNTLLNICSHANCFAGYLGLKTAWGDVCGTMTTFDSFCSQQNQPVDVVILYDEVHRNLPPSILHFTLSANSTCNMIGRDVFLLIS